MDWKHLKCHSNNNWLTINMKYKINPIISNKSKLNMSSKLNL